jgi:hypothetical protein
MFGSVKTLPNKGGRPRSITPVVLKALCDRKANLYPDEIAIFCGTKSISMHQNLTLVARLYIKAG